MVPVGYNTGSRFKCNLHTIPSPNTHLQFLKLHRNVTYYISLSFLPRNGYNAYFSFCMASFSKNCITVVNYRIRIRAPYKNVRLGMICCRGWQQLTRTPMKSLNITSLQQKRALHENYLYQRRWVGFFRDSSWHCMNSRTETWNSSQKYT